MRLSSFIAKRYLFGRKATHAIQIITGISVLGLAIGTTALILILSVFNGFEGLLTELFGAFNPDIKVESVEGKYFTVDSSKLREIKNIDGVEEVSVTLEEIAMFDYSGQQDFATVKGVDDHFLRVNPMDTVLKSGNFKTRGSRGYYAVAGAGIAFQLGISLQDKLNEIKVYMPKRERTGPLDQPFRTHFLYPSGIFSIQQEYDYQYILTHLEFVRGLLNSPDKASAFEIRVTSRNQWDAVQDELRSILGPGFSIENRYEQDAAFLRLMNIEKWISYAILAFMLLLVSFNLVGALWMVVLDKIPDIAILKAMGATDQFIRRVFIKEGLLISGFALLAGILIAVGLYLLQIYYGIIQVPRGFIVDEYPIAMHWTDLLIVSATVLIIGWLASLLPAYRASRVSPAIREE